MCEVEEDGLPSLAFHREPAAPAPPRRPSTPAAAPAAAALGAPRYRPLAAGTIARAEVLERLGHELERFNREPRESSRPLHPQVLAASLPAVLRVWRALHLPGGHALLVGPRGARKASLARLAAFAAGLRVVELPSRADEAHEAHPNPHPKPSRSRSRSRSPSRSPSPSPSPNPNPDRDEAHESAWLRQALCGVLRAACTEPRKTALVLRSAQLGSAAQVHLALALAPALAPAPALALGLSLALALALAPAQAFTLILPPEA